MYISIERYFSVYSRILQVGDISREYGANCCELEAEEETNRNSLSQSAVLAMVGRMERRGQREWMELSPFVPQGTAAHVQALTPAHAHYHGDLPPLRPSFPSSGS